MVNIPYTDDIETTETGLVIHGQPDFHTWCSLWQWLKERDKAMPWILGDMLNYGESAYGEMYTQVLDTEELQAHFRPNTLKQYKFIASQWPRSSRLDEIPWSWHQAVTSLPVDQRLIALQQIQTEPKNKRNKLRQLVQQLGNGQVQLPPTYPEDTIHELTEENYEQQQRIDELEQKLEAVVIQPTKPDVATIRTRIESILSTPALELISRLDWLLDELKSILDELRQL